jgi:hypothetical protein
MVGRLTPKQLGTVSNPLGPLSQSFALPKAPKATGNTTLGTLVVTGAHRTTLPGSSSVAASEQAQQDTASCRANTDDQPITIPGLLLRFARATSESLRLRQGWQGILKRCCCEGALHSSIHMP